MHGRGPSNINLGIIVFAGLHNQSSLLTMCFSISRSRCIIFTFASELPSCSVFHGHKCARRVIKYSELTAAHRRNRDREPDNFGYFACELLKLINNSSS